MISTVDQWQNWQRNRRMRAMFQARKRVFVDLLRWDLPVVGGQFEIDQFDTPDAIYLILTDRAGEHLASARLLPTTQPHILDSLFPQLCDGPPPTGSTIYEITRFCLDRSLNAVERREARNRLVSAIVDYALQHGITEYTGVADTAWFQQILAFGWRCRPLGLPVHDKSSMLVALAITITAETPSLLADAGIYRPDIAKEAWDAAA